MIGAGPAGLTAALCLLRAGERSVTVLEKNSYAGGIGATLTTPGGKMDIGGHRFFTKSRRAAEFWESLLPLQGAVSMDDGLKNRRSVLRENGPDPEKENKVMLSRQRISRIFFGGKFYDYPVTLSTVFHLGLRTVPAFFSYLRAKVRKRKENSLEDFYINRFGRCLYKLFFESYTEKVWGVHPSDIPPDWGVQRVKGISVGVVLKDMLFKGSAKEASLTSRFLYPKFGPGQLWDAAAEEIENLGGRIIYDCKITDIKLSDCCVSGVCTDRGYFEADTLLSSAPLPELIAMLPNVPDGIKEICSQLEFRDFITVGIELDGMKMKNNTKFGTFGDIIPDCWIYVQDKRLRVGRIQVFNNWSPYMVPDVKNKILLGMEYFCSKGDDFWSMSDGDICSLAAEELCASGIADKRNIVGTYCHREEKAYPSYVGGYSRISDVRQYLDGIGGLYCIGRNGQHRYNNMDHSMLTAMTACDVILTLGDKTSLWSVNPDDEYCENQV